MIKYKTVFGYTLVPEQEWINTRECVRRCDSYKACYDQVKEQRDTLLNALADIHQNIEKSIRKAHITLENDE